MIQALLAFAHIVVILWMLWRLDRSYQRGGEAEFGLLSLKGDQAPPPKPKAGPRA